MSQDETCFDPLSVIVLAGGSSAEREVSIDSGRCVAEALRGRGHAVELFDPAEQLLSSLRGRTSIVLPMLHGTGAEDGTLQEQLTELGLTWVGSSAAASRLTFDKIATRKALQNAGLPVADGIAIDVGMSPDVVRREAGGIGFPLVVKPAEQGSSVGVSIVRSESELDQALASAFHWGPRAVIEEFVAGREITVPVVDGRVLPLVEILPARDWYDYDAKYSDDRTGYRVHPSGLPPGIEALVTQACDVCGVTGISRTDLRVTSAGRCCILEINTIPGMTSHSLVPMSAKAMGLSLGALCEQVIRLVLAANVDQRKRADRSAA